MGNETISREEHNEFVKRIEEENGRQNHRIENLEETVREIGAISTNVEKLAMNMDGVLRQMEAQNDRLKALEGRDGENWRKIVWTVATAIVGIVVGFIFSHFGM